MKRTATQAGPDGPSVRLLIDGDCPFCSAEAGWLGRRDRCGRLTLEDIRAAGFDAARYGADPAAVRAGLHAVLPDGRVVTRMDAVRSAYEAVGLGWITAPTRWPGLRRLFDAAYDLFARNRVRWGDGWRRLLRSTGFGPKA
jgi:predicted DCC family thiol-disulfide oxidoreductase YuxK